jgi:hypothetical protein
VFFFIHFHPLFTCSCPYWLSASFGLFLFIHSLLVLSLMGFLPILVVSIHPLFTCSFPYGLSANFGCFNSSTFIHSLLVLSLFGFLSILAGFFIHFHPLFTCSFPYWLSANFGCFFLSSTFIHSLRGLERVWNFELDRVCTCTFGQVLFWLSFRWWQN